MEKFTKEELLEIFTSATSKVRLAEALGIKTKNGTKMNKEIEEYASIIGFDTSLVNIHNKRRTSSKQAEDEYNKHPKICKCCGKILNYSKRNGEFCSSSCAAKYNNTHRILNVEGKTKFVKCVDCGKEIEVSIYSNPLQCRCEDCKKKRRVIKQSESFCKRNCKNSYLKDRLLICVVCGKQYRPVLLSSGYYSVSKCCCEDCHKELVSRNAKLAYQKVNEEGRFQGWKSRNIISYAERFWMNVLDNNNIKYQKEYSLNGKYFLDFLLEKNGKKIDLEIDGKQHQYEERKIHDKRRDEYIISEGYIVYRISWNRISTKSGSLLMKEKIDKFLEFYNSV